MAALLKDDSNDPLVVASSRELSGKLQQVFSQAKSFDRQLIDHLEQVVYDHRANFKSVHGVSFPEIVPFFLPTHRFICFERRDLTDTEIRNKLVQMIRDISIRGVRLEAVEFAAAVIRTWPKYRPPVEELRNDPKTENQLQ